MVPSNTSSTSILSRSSRSTSSRSSRTFRTVATHPTFRSPSPEPETIRTSRSPRSSSPRPSTIPSRIHDLKEDAENKQHGGKFKPTSDDDACFKLWNIYISQGQEYDKGLIESWKSDMDGMILFSALYSASLTAFLIESYKRLQADPEDTTVAILTQISQQLVLMSNGTSLGTFQQPPSFQPATSSLVCNIFWFLSLALALTCSLLATFVQQWTRDFMHKTTMRPSPVVQARVLAFSYFGLRRFGMHTFVDVIPILLHISLFLFFAGLVGFLLPVNLPLTYLMACVLAIFVVVYFSLSLLPLLFLDAPYRTPFSDFLWRLGNRLHGLLLRRHKLVGERSLTQAIIEKALQNPAERDRQCMEYTMRSLNHDSELIPMFQAVGDAVLSPQGGVRLDNFNLVAPLLHSTNPDLNIISRIVNFISISGTSADPTRQIFDLTTSLCALWSLAHLLIRHTSQISADPYSTPRFWFHRSVVHVLLISSTSAPRSHVISTVALVRTSRMQSLKHFIDIIHHVLCNHTITAHQRLHCAIGYYRCLSVEDIDWESQTFRDSFIELGRSLEEGCTPLISDSRSEELLEEAQDGVEKLCDPARWKAAVLSILNQYLCSARHAEVLPIGMDVTYWLITTSLPYLNPLSPLAYVEADEAVASYVLNGAFEENNTTPEIFFYFVQVFFSTSQASRSPFSAECRGFIQHYLHNCEEPEIAYLLDRDYSRHFEECVLHDLRADQAYWPGMCISVIDDMYYGLGLRRGISPRLRTFANQIFDLIPTLSTKFTQCRWWNLTNAQTEWVLCKDIIDGLGSIPQNLLSVDDTGMFYGSLIGNPTIMENIRALGQRLLVDCSALERPPPDTDEEYTQWRKELVACVMSMNLMIISKFIGMTTLYTSQDPLLGDWDNMRGARLIDYEGRIDRKVQIQFADNVAKLVSLAPWNADKESPTASLFHKHLWVVSRTWVWIDDLECARILVEAIQRHRNYKNFKGWCGTRRFVMISA